MTNKDTTEKSFKILPHPAKTNDPADIESNKKSSTGGAFHAPGPFIPTEAMKKDMPLPASSEELRARQAQLNALHSQTKVSEK